MFQKSRRKVNGYKFFNFKPILLIFSPKRCTCSAIFIFYSFEYYFILFSPLQVIRQQVINHLNLVWKQINVFPQDSIQGRMRYLQLRGTPSCSCLKSFFSAGSNLLNALLGSGGWPPERGRSWTEPVSLNFWTKRKIVDSDGPLLTAKCRQYARRVRTSVSLFFEITFDKFNTLLGCKSVHYDWNEMEVTHNAQDDCFLKAQSELHSHRETESCACHQIRWTKIAELVLHFGEKFVKMWRKLTKL